MKLALVGLGIGAGWVIGRANAPVGKIVLKDFGELSNAVVSNVRVEVTGRDVSVTNSDFSSWSAVDDPVINVKAGAETVMLAHCSVIASERPISLLIADRVREYRSAAGKKIREVLAPKRKAAVVNIAQGAHIVGDNTYRNNSKPPKGN